MERLDSLEHLLVHEIKDLYHAEQQLVKALPKVAKKASSAHLRQLIEQHLEETEGHVTKLEQVFRLLHETPKAVKCKGMQGILEEGEELIEEKGSPETLDAAIIAAAQKVEHYEMAGYGTAAAWAEMAGHQEVKTILNEILEEEEAADQKLTELATADINRRSAQRMREAA
jgi:ferritin-like metal-binding protein YciE